MDMVYSIFFFNDTATTEIYTLSLHDALPIYRLRILHRPHIVRPNGKPIGRHRNLRREIIGIRRMTRDLWLAALARSEEHTSELQSRQYLVCRLLLEKK